MRARSNLGVAAVLVAMLLALSCAEERRSLESRPPASGSALGQMFSRSAGPAVRPAATPSWLGHMANEFADYGPNAYAMSQGKLLFHAYNCSGCHSEGGGGIGPSLMDTDRCITCRNPEDIFSTIVQGRQSGMPAYGGRIPAYQIWQLVAYVRSLSGQAASTAAPGRNDDMNLKPPENSMPKPRPLGAPSNREKAG